MHECFEPTDFRAPTLAVIRQANTIIDEYAALGFTLTLRQLFYQFVSRDLIPNVQSQYDRLGAIVSDARRAGWIDWDAIEDRTRFLRELTSWDDPADRIRDAANNYREDVWVTQPYRPEVWIEKDALVGVIEGVCDEYRIPHFSCRGNVSDSEMYIAAKRLVTHVPNNQTPLVLHLGDHDPSGLDMTRDIDWRLYTFSEKERVRAHRQGVNALIEVRRLALNLDQTTGLPPNTAKESDSKYAKYAQKFGDESWELDALDPVFIADLIRDAADTLIDQQAWDAAIAQEEANRAKLVAAAESWGEDDEDEDDIDADILP
jgi:hypothetical protein